jgi:serine protease Do
MIGASVAFLCQHKQLSEEHVMQQQIGNKLRRWKLGFGLLAASIAGFAGSQIQGFTFQTKEPPPAEVRTANDLSTAFRYASNKVMPAVVLIRTTPTDMQRIGSDDRSTAPDALPDEMPPELRRFFGQGMPKLPQQQPRVPRGEGMGSGVIIDPSGIILTNNHVVQGGKVTVRLHDGREFDAVQVKSDPKTDIAIVRIEGAGALSAATLANSDAVQIGDWVLAVGAPFGLKETVTAGIISAKSRGIGINEREEFLQTDAAINPGNSGGPLVNIQGEVVGINTAISSQSGGNEGIGFAVPANVAQWVSKQLIQDGTVHRAFLGVGIQAVTSDLSKQMGLKAVSGALVTEVRPDTAASKAGLQTGDVIVEFDHHQVVGPRELQSYVEQAVVNQPHEVTVARNGDHKTITVNLQNLASDTQEASTNPAHQEKTDLQRYGLEVGTLTKELADQLELKGIKGVVVTGIKPGSTADRAGIQEGMVISRLGRTEIKSMADFQAAMKATTSKEGLLLLVRTPQGSRFVVLKAS